MASSGLGCDPFEGSGSVVVDSLLIVAPIVGFYVCSMCFCVLLRTLSSFAIIMIVKGGIVALLWCLVIVIAHGAVGRSAVVCDFGIS